MKEYIKINRIAYNALCENYDRRATEKSEFEERVEVLAGSVLALAKAEFNQINLLEVGPGSGEALLFFERNGCRTLAVELSERMALTARRRSPNTFFIVEDIMDVNFIDKQFEIIYAGALIHLFPFKDAAILVKKIHSWLKPNGFLFISTTTHSYSEEGLYTKVDYKIPVERFRRKWTEEEFVQLLLNNDFEIVKKIFTDEKDRMKRWIGLIGKKV